MSFFFSLSFLSCLICVGFEASISSVDLPNKAPDEATEPAQGRVRNQFECLSPANRKRPRSCFAESGQEAGRTNQRGNSHARGSSVREDSGGRVEGDSKASLAPTSSNTDQEVVQEEASTPDAYLPPGWTRLKLEPDW
jgi:hypothetical protein